MRKHVFKLQGKEINHILAEHLIHEKGLPHGEYKINMEATASPVSLDITLTLELIKENQNETK